MPSFNYFNDINTLAKTSAKALAALGCLLSTAAQANAAEDTLSVTLHWDAVAYADGYRLQEQSPNGQFETVFEGAATRVDLEERLPGDYQYRIVSCLNVPEQPQSNCELGNYSAPVTVTLAHGPDLSQRRVVFIHTDLLGSPASETDIEGNPLNQ